MSRSSALPQSRGVGAKDRRCSAQNKPSPAVPAAVPAADVLIDPEFRDLIQPLRPDELHQLEENLLAEGCRDPLVRWKGHGLLLDGHHRYLLCSKHGIQFRVNDVELPDREAAELWIVETHLGRRNLTDDQRAAMAHLVTKQRVEISKRERAAKAAAARHDSETGQSGCLEAAAASKQPEDSPLPKTRERARAAKAANVSERKVRAVVQIEKVLPGMVKEIAAGKVTIPQAKAAAKASQLRTAGDEGGAAGDAPTDQMGRPLPDREDVRQAFAARPQFARVLNLQVQLTQALNVLWAEGGHGTACLAQLRHRINAHYAEARILVRDYQPHVVCPECTGREIAGRDACGKCGGRGWLPLEAWKRHEEAARARSPGKGAA